MNAIERLRIRNLFKNLLELISSAEEQYNYQEMVPIAEVPAELVTMWFDDHYRPEEEWFKEAFTAAEQQTIAEFSTYYSERIPRLPQTTSVTELQESSVWQEITIRAQTTLRELRMSSKD